MNLTSGLVLPGKSNNCEKSEKEKNVKSEQARLLIGYWLGTVPSPDITDVEKRRKIKNEEIQDKLRNGEMVYGVTHFTPMMYLQYELTRIKLDYTVYKGEALGGYPCRVFSETDLRQYYDNNRDLFTRYFGDSFGFEEVAMIIEKRLKEKEYEDIVKDLLCKHEEWK